MTGTFGASDCTAASTAAWSGPGSSTSRTSRAGSRARTASSTAIPSLTGLTTTPSDRKVRSTEADAAVGGSARRTGSFGGMAVPATDNTGGERGTPPGGATGSIPNTLPATDGRSQSANGGTSHGRPDRSSQPENDAPPNGSTTFVVQALSGRSGAVRRPVGAP